MIDYEEFQDGLRKGLQALWKTEFMSGLRNGGFEQTLRNVCLFHIEKATGRVAFTESRGRADLLLCGEEDETCTRCEFKVNFASQYAKVLTRKSDAIRQVQKQTQHIAQDGIIVYAIAELIQSPKGLLGMAKLHNEHVESTPYKQFQTCYASDEAMEAVRTRMENDHEGPQGTVPAFDALFHEEAPSLEWQGNSARLHVWTHHMDLPYA